MIRKETGLNQIDFAREFSLSQSALKDYERGATEPPVKLLIGLCEQLEVSAEWLLLGKGLTRGSEFQKKAKRAAQIAYGFFKAEEIELTEEEFAEVSGLLLEYYCSHEDAKPQMENQILNGITKRIG